MLILYVLSVLSFCALVWAAISITRHIRQNAAQQKAAASKDDAADYPPVANRRRSA